MARKKRPIKTNVNIHYLVPMCRLSDSYSTELREVRIINPDDGMIRCQVVEDVELFQVHSFWDDYFQFLIYRGYVIPIDDGVS